MFRTMLKHYNWGRLQTILPVNIYIIISNSCYILSNIFDEKMFGLPLWASIRWAAFIWSDGGDDGNTYDMINNTFIEISLSLIV